MKPIIMLAICASAAFSQDRAVAVDGAQYLIRVQAVDTTKQAEMKITMAGGMFASLGASAARSGGVSLHGSGGTGWGTVLGSLIERTGSLTFSSTSAGLDLELIVTTVSEPSVQRLIARGTTVTVSYNDALGLGVEARR
jgi:hypothetical protein